MGGDIQAIGVRPKDPSSPSSGLNLLFEVAYASTMTSNISFPGIGQRVAHGHAFQRRGTVSRGFFQRIPRGHVEESSTASSAVSPVASTFHLQVGLSSQVRLSDSRKEKIESSINFLPIRGRFFSEEETLGYIENNANCEWKIAKFIL